MPDLVTFHEGVKRGDLRAVQIALEGNPQLLNERNEAGQTAFLLAKYYGRTAVADYLLSLDPELDVWTATAAGRTDLVLHQVATDPSLLEQRNTDGWTLLHMAAFFGQLPLAEKLVDLGMSPDVRSGNMMENTPLHAAVAGRQTEMVRSLLQHGADANAVQGGGWRPLHGAAGNGDLTIVELLLAHGADKEARAANNQSALDLALQKGHGEVVAVLEDREAAHS